MHPYLFKIGNFELRIYSLMLMTAVLVALYFVSKRAKKLNYNPKIIENTVIFSFLGAIVGARLYYVIFNWPYFKEYPMEILAVWHGGLAIHGGIIAGALTAIIYTTRNNISVFSFGDMAAPFILLGQGIGRFGNFANGEAHGVPTITPPDIIFRLKPIFSKFWNETLAQTNTAGTPTGITDLYHKIIVSTQTVVFQGKEYLLKEYVPWGISFPPTYKAQAYMEFGSMPIHPTFFYEMILNFIGAGILLLLWRKDANIGTGKVFSLYLIMYAVIRAFVTFFRADDLMLGPIRAPHAASIALVIFAVIVYMSAKVYRARWNK